LSVPALVMLRCDLSSFGCRRGPASLLLRPAGPAGRS